MHPNIRSVLIIPVSGSIERSTTSTLMTCEHLGLGYFLHIPMTTCDQGCLAGGLVDYTVVIGTGVTHSYWKSCEKICILYYESVRDAIIYTGEREKRKSRTKLCESCGWCKKRSTAAEADFKIACAPLTAPRPADPLALSSPLQMGDPQSHAPPLLLDITVSNAVKKGYQTGY